MPWVSLNVPEDITQQGQQEVNCFPFPCGPCVDKKPLHRPVLGTRKRRFLIGSPTVWDNYPVPCDATRCCWGRFPWGMPLFSLEGMQGYLYLEHVGYDGKILGCSMQPLAQWSEVTKNMHPISPYRKMNPFPPFPSYVQARNKYEYEALLSALWTAAPHRFKVTSPTHIVRYTYIMTIYIILVLYDVCGCLWPFQDNPETWKLKGKRLQSTSHPARLVPPEILHWPCHKRRGKVCPSHAHDGNDGQHTDFPCESFPATKPPCET